MARLTSRTTTRVTPQLHRETIEIPNDYYLENSRGWLSVVVPEASQQFIRNPQLLDLDGNNIPDTYSPALISGAETYTSTGGPYGGGLFIATNVTGGTFTNVQGNQLPIGTYTTSWVLKGTGKVRLRVTDTINTISEIIYDLSNEWTQFVLPSFVITAPTPFVLFLEPVGTVPNLEIGFVQLENLDHATTPFDGSFSGYQFEDANSYRWSGVANQSNSTRSINTISGGQIINLSEHFGLCITAVEGFGIPSELNVVASPFALRSGSLVRCKTIESRALTIEGQLLKCRLKDLLCARSNLGAAIFSQSQQRKFIWQPFDNCEPCPCVEFIACLTDGLQGTIDNLYGENIELELTMFDPNFSPCYSQTVELDVSEVNSYQSLIGINEEGEAVNIFADPSSPTNILTLYDLCVSSYNGNLYYAFLATDATRQIWCYDGDIHQMVGIAGGAVDVTHDNVLRVECCGQWLYIGGSFLNIGAAGPFVGTSGISIAQFDLQTNTINNIGDILDATTGSGNGYVTAIDCIDESTGEMAIGGLFDTAGGVAALNLSRYDAISATFVFNNFPIMIDGQINDMMHYVENGNERVVYVGNFQSNNDATWSNAVGIPGGIAATDLPESIGWFDGTNVQRTDFVFEFAGPNVVSNVTSTAFLNNVLFIGGNMGYGTGTVPAWVGSAADTIKGIAVLDLNQFQNTFGGLTGRLLPLQGNIDNVPPTGWGTNGTQPTAEFNGLLGNIEIVRDMEVIDGELYVVGSLTGVGLIDSTGTIDVNRGIIAPQTTICGGFIWTPSATNARIGTARPIEIDLLSADLIGEQCRVLSITSIPDNAPDVLGLSHIYQIDSNSVTLANFEIGGSTTVDMCDADLIDIPFSIHIEGPGELQQITVNNTVVFSDIDNPVIIPDGTTFIANYENIPATFEQASGVLISPQNFRQATLDSPTNSVVLKFRDVDQADLPSAFIRYKARHISAEYLQCGNCV